ncbi:hypothetical protein ELH39_01040 [Rhizobium ruizarguesonis]|uniref:hypothetical protein n=1 Tax=Rhizobium ruizarguesonis TaxID=2081791 RepID=UPI001031A24C|nr:hypothetical protein [Rhizobium ruizarguesonis]TBB95935.1 hypothetical protein ELH39_01040 [Rhizobium ruizarguesonis]
MAHLILDPIVELDTLTSLISQAVKVLDAGASGRFESRKRELQALIRGQQNEIAFGLANEKPIVTVNSLEYKGLQDGQASPVSAEFSFNWSLRRVGATGKFEVRGGGTNVAFKNQNGDVLRQFHFDACRGGQDAAGGIAHHPFSHFQYKGDALADLPRIPSLVLTPSDVLEQTLLDLWPKQWHTIAAGSKGKAQLKTHHNGQKRRVEKIALKFIDHMKTAVLPLRGLQAPLAADFDLHL